jgi:hypothetical protein
LVVGVLGLAGLGTASCSSGSLPGASAAARSSQNQNVSIQLDTSGPGHPDWPQYGPSNITLTKGDQVTLTIVNHDDGPAALPAPITGYADVQGGTETVDGAPVTSEPNPDVAHTFTAPELGVNVVIPAAPQGGSNTVVFTFRPTKVGMFTWNCYAPCGTGPNGYDGPMVTGGWMTGKITVS